jgi:hypothetical protein
MRRLILTFALGLTLAGCATASGAPGRTAARWHVPLRGRQGLHRGLEPAGRQGPG